MRLRQRSGRDRGAAAVEFALVAPLLLLLIFAVIDFGRMFNQLITTTEAAREAARLAAVQPSGDIDVRMGVGGDVRARAEKVAGTVSGLSSGGTTCQSASATGESAVSITVTKNFEYVTPIGVIAGFFGGGDWAGSFGMSATGVMSCRA